MKTALSLGLALAALAIGAGCSSSPGSRIAKNRDAFESYPPEVRTAIEAGRVDVGFTPEQVRMALGKPDRVLTRTTDAGAAETWVYLSRRGGVGVGLGLGMGGGGSAVGGGVGVGSGGTEERLRVTFAGGRVTAVEQAGR